MTTILIADDELSIRTILGKAFQARGFDVIKTENGTMALEALRTRPIDVALLDIRMPGKTGLEILKEKTSFASQPAVFIMTAQDTMDNAIEAMKRGAYDYVAKPFDMDEVQILVDRALETKNLKIEVERLKTKSVRPGTIIGKTKGIRELIKTIGKVAEKDVTVLIQGESGTGKELIAQAIHANSPRALKPFVAVNCSAIPAHLLESELFGAKKGAYTGSIADNQGYMEQANGGTLFLDEIGDMPLELQAKLLRVLQDKKIQRLGDNKTITVDVRILAATNQNLAGRIQKGLFREDLFFRLNVVPLNIPALRERKSDIPLLVEHFLEQNAEQFASKVSHLTSEAMEYLQEKDWPGNIRELENLLKRACVLTQETSLQAKHFSALESGNLEDQPVTANNLDELQGILHQSLKGLIQKISAKKKQKLYDIFVPLMEKPLIVLALQKTQGNQIQAAKILGINRNTLRKKMKDLKIPRGA